MSGAAAHATARDPADVPAVALEQSLPERFATQVHRHGDRVAVRDAAVALTYAQLDAASNRVTAALLEREAGGRRVALRLAHGAWLPVAVLGVLKAGLAYVPLDPRHPAERSAALLDDADAGLLLTDAEHAPAAHALAARAAGRCTVVTLDDTTRYPASDPAQRVPPDALAAIVYTSGSTGRPKGVCHEHRTLVHAAMAYTSLARLGPDDRLSLLHSATAIASATALWAALLNGGTICPFDVRAWGLDRLATWIDRERITVLHMVPTLFRRLAQQLPDGHRFPDVRILRLGGEAVTRTEWRLFRAHCTPGAALHVGLSSTEALNFRQGLYPWAAAPVEPVLDVGGPVPGKEVTLVGSDGEAVAPGRIGEVVVRSEYLFAGYWRQPGSTARVLSVDPGNPRRRAFRTGDLARLGGDGRLWHVGRVDAQVKVAGNRVETAEVEHALRALPGVRDAAVILRPWGAHDVRLVAFVETGGAPAPDPRGLRERLHAVLPAHLVPSGFVALDALPCLPGGKVDRHALAARAGAARGGPAPPRNPIEETLVQICQRALGAGAVGVEDDLFLHHGADSLAAVQVLAEVADLFGRELPLEVFHQATTVAALATRLQEAGWRAPDSGRLALHADGPRIPLFAVCGAFGHALRLLLVGRALGPEQPFHALQPPGMDWERAGCRTVEAMAAHYLATVRRIQARGPYRLLGTSFGGVMAFEMALQLQAAGEGVSLLAMVDTTPPSCTTAAGLDQAPRRDWTAGIDASDRLVADGVRVARAHRAALDRYVLTRRYDGTLLYFRCVDGADPAARDRRPLWRSFATDGMHVVPVPGCHGDFHREPQRSAVVEALRRALAPPA